MVSTISKDIVGSILEDKPLTKNQKLKVLYNNYLNLGYNFPHLLDLPYYNHISNRVSTIMRKFKEKERFVQLSQEEKEFVDTMVEQWTDKRVIRFFKIMEKKRPWLADINITYYHIQKSPVISEKQGTIIIMFLRQYSTHKDDIKLIEKETPAVREYAYRSVVEHEYINPLQFKEILSGVKNKKIKDRMLYVQSVLVAYTRLRNKDERLHTKIKKKYPLSDANFSTIEGVFSQKKLNAKITIERKGTKLKTVKYVNI